MTDEKVRAFCKEYFKTVLPLNSKMLEECVKINSDLNCIEDFLKAGADPLGPTDLNSAPEALYDLVLSEACSCKFNNKPSIKLPEITKLFMRYGMDMNNPIFPYAEEDFPSPMYTLSFLLNESGLKTFKVLLDYGIDSALSSEVWYNSVHDIAYCNETVFSDNSSRNTLFILDENSVDFDNCSDEDLSLFIATYAMKSVMLAASYEHILSDDEYLRNFISCKNNNYDFSKFRDLNRFIYEFDISDCSKTNHFVNSVVTIYDSTTKEKVWQFKIQI